MFLVSADRAATADDPGLEIRGWNNHEVRLRGLHAAPGAARGPAPEMALPSPLFLCGSA